ncbi:DUF3710 domain-containing protein [Kitasatospora sp. LaBMicrA B282]|uniref:DUF3710 domain-containing protein n=1 Tax=Kitasatospora sp. LaBMicrA B282 TaxID=3420949 RepID=UPI003D09681D
MFRRRQKSEDAVEQLAEDAISADETADDVEGTAGSESETSTDAEELDDELEVDLADRVGLPPAPRPDGPWDHAELESPAEGRVDLGGLLIPGVEGMELRVEVAGDAIVAATLVLGNSAIQLQAFAAPRTEGIWSEVRDEIADGIRAQGGLAEIEEGNLGWHLRAQVPVQLPDGTQGVQLVRFVGCDGPRWFLRGVISGQAAVQPETADVLEQVFRQTVVVRGEAPMAPRDPIVLKLPEDAQMVADAGVGTQEKEGSRFGDTSLSPFARGPEITEVR